MKNWFLLAVLALMFAISLPAYASPPDPGGTIAMTFESPALVGTTTTVSPDMTTLESIVGLLAVALILTGFVSRRVFSIPWRTSFKPTMEDLELNMRRTFAKLTKSPVLKRQVS